ncbi:TRAP transporter small permease [Afifella pfennigii]|uniref:TRAP transporter small permease n=1 Tax=Afifella pfennigii TaxID=209897 RepID=UPI00068E24A2|nr:TRAP transporter small permease [Afifella pfennigii]
MNDGTVPEFVKRDRFGSLLDRCLGLLLAVDLFAMMVFTFFDVVGRYFFNTPMPGGSELTQLMLAALIFAALPIVTRHNEHITIDLFDKAIPASVRGLRDRAVDLVCIPVYGILGWLMWEKAGRVLEYGDYTESLRIPMAPIVYFMTLTLLLSAGVLVINFLWPRPSRSLDGTSGSTGA